MKSLITMFSVVLLSLSTNAVQAAEHSIATVYNEDNQSVTYKLVIESTDGRSIKNFYKDTYSSNAPKVRTALPANALLTLGIILEERDAYKIMVLKSNNYDAEQGGIITIDTLNNAITGERRNYELQLAKNKNGWALFSNNKAIKEMHIKTNKVFLIGTVGIKTIVLK